MTKVKKTYVLAVLEYTSPVWGPSSQLISRLSQDIEAIQIRACKIIMGKKLHLLRKGHETLSKMRNWSMNIALIDS